MSKLSIKSSKGEEFKLNVTQFRSPMNATITSVQTKKMLQHFPIRAAQPDINFTVVFASNADKHAFQDFVRKHQLNAQTDNNGMVTLMWPERDIENWTGYIVEFRVIEARFIYAPRVTFGVALIDSLMSTRTSVSSSAVSFNTVFGEQVPAWLADTFVDNIVLPTMPTSSDPVASNPVFTDPTNGPHDPGAR